MDRFGVCALLGRVEFSPRIQVCSQHGRLRDWALVELEQDGFTTKLSELRNKIPVTLALRLMVHRVPGSAIDRVQRLHFGTSLEVAVGPRVIPRSEQDDRGLVVMKHGKTSGFTMGRANGIQSLIRVKDVTSSEWCIIGMDGQKPFSAEGDAGACVFDLQGRIGGMITSGLEANKDPFRSHDVTYATPVEWLLEDIARHGYDLKLPN
ncbi:uncharacterized protein FTJAE_7230 [Fusarium tjaetaba]|uniref:Uncharacterized protein n=1 Tax=Fusarium tjaetaba TaxID=1567544 RepID=A0A8H5REK7_9HYPO|nr:uncharacterized protein FTJAE_7230 [Fusarium tjaetaba]KAF5633266.1 hypothetical protein FTJAE_7230 [Fusarium tjaetaba]